MFEIQVIQQERLSGNFALQGFLVLNETVSNRTCWYISLIELIEENNNVYKAVLPFPLYSWIGL
jgi:hypothetical protein